MKAYLTWSNLNRTQSERDRSLFVRRGKKGRQATAAKFLLNPKSRKLHETMLRTVCETRVNRKKHSISIPILFDQSQGWSYSLYTDRGQSWRRSKIWNTLKIVSSFTPAISGRNLDSFFFSPGSLPSQSSPLFFDDNDDEERYTRKMEYFYNYGFEWPRFFPCLSPYQTKQFAVLIFRRGEEKLLRAKMQSKREFNVFEGGRQDMRCAMKPFFLCPWFTSASLSLSLAIYHCSISLFLSLTLFLQMQILS